MPEKQTNERADKGRGPRRALASQAHGAAMRRSASDRSAAAKKNGPDRGPDTAPGGCAQGGPHAQTHAR